MKKFLSILFASTVVLTASAVPAGEHKTYSRSASIFYNGFGVTMSTVENYASDIVSGADNTVYIKAPLSYDKMPADVYMKGTVKDNVITVKFPQEYANIAGVNCTLNRMEYKITNEEEQKGLYFISDKNEITYTIQPDGRVIMEESVMYSDEIDLPDFILGLADTDGNWGGFGDYNQVYEPFADNITTLPQGCDIKKMQIGWDGYAAQVMDMAVKDNTVYLAGFNPYTPEACIVGTISGDKLSFKTGQYMGVDDDWHSFAYFWAIGYEMADNPFTGELGLQMTPIESLDFNWNGEKMSFATNNTLAINLGNEDLSYISLYKEVSGSPHNADAIPAAPMAPVFDVVDEYNPDEYYQYGKVRFLLPMLDVNGNMLDTSKMYYNFLIDGTPYEFKASEYMELEQDITDIPWDFRDREEYGGYDFLANNITHIVYFYKPDMKMLNHMALQQYYRNDDGSVLASEITHYGNPASIDEVSASVTVYDVEYYSLHGNKVNRPQSGIYLKKTTFLDGSIKTAKVMIK